MQYHNSQRVVHGHHLSWLMLKVYRGDFLGTLALAPAPYAQAKKIEKGIWGFPEVPIELLHIALFDRLYGCIILLLDWIQRRPNWLSRTALRRPLLRPLPRSVAHAHCPSSLFRRIFGADSSKRWPDGARITPRSWLRWSPRSPYTST